MANELVVTKRKIASYVHDAADMEKRILTLEQAAEDLEEKSKEKKTRAYQKRNTDEKNKISLRPMDKNTQNYYCEERSYIGFDKYWKEYYKDESFNFAPKGIGCGPWIVSFILAWIMMGILAVLSFGAEIEWNDEILDILFIVFALVIRLIWRLILRASSNATCNKVNSKITLENQKHRQEYESKIADQEAYNEKVDENNKKYRQALADKRQELDREAEELEREAQFYAAQAEETRKALEPLYKQRKKFYSVGIIPPDYRTIDCAYVFDQIFRNDLADNMREAVKIYEERVFRGEIIRGVRSLGQLMGNVSSLLTRLQTDMSSIKSEIGSMNKGVVRIYEQNQLQNNAMLDEVKRNNAALESRNRELFKETQMSRYALESLKENNDKLMKYIED